MKDKVVLQQNETIDIIYRVSTGAYYYTTYIQDRPVQSGEGESMEILYGIVERTRLAERWEFRPVSDAAKKELRANPLPTDLTVA